MNNTKLLPYQTILNASHGDVIALEKALSHFDSYINKLATHAFYDERGCVYYYVDGELKLQLQMKLVVAIMKFCAED